MDADYVIVGAGSAGCVLANRLSADPANRVLLLEAGPPDDALSLKIPSAMAVNLAGRKHNWAFDSEPEPQLGGRRVRHDRGKTLGGSSSINGMVYIRGHAKDYDGWRQMGCEGWSYADVLPYFKRAETFDGGADRYRGGEGPLHVSLPRPLHPLSEAFLKAGAEAGYPASEDINGYRQEGFARLNRTIRRGERWSAARAYLRPAESRPNLTVVPKVLAQRILFEDGRAAGVELRDADGRLQRANARKEVILSAGAVGSPHLLMLSGIGPAAHLQEKGIAPLADRPGVGANLNDHPDFVIKIKCKQPITLWPATRWPRKGLVGLRWLFSRDGVCASNHFDAVACLRSGPDVAYPDLQFTLAPIATELDSWDALGMHAFQIHVGLMRAYSRGEIRLADADPRSAPKIHVNYLDDRRDLERMRQGARMVRRLLDMPAFQAYRGEEIFPGDAVRSDAQLDEALRAALATQWHLSCTAKMGPASDPMAVVDPAGRVYGVAGLRVIDASVMPEVVNGNTNGPTIMLAEKLSDAVLGKPPLARETVEVWDAA